MATVPVPAPDPYPTGGGAGGGVSVGQVQAMVSAAVAALVDDAPAMLDTLAELAAALNDDENFAVTVMNTLAGKVAKGGDAEVLWVGDESDVPAPEDQVAGVLYVGLEEA